MEWYIKVLKNYVNFSGRARRKEYWMFVLFNFLICILAMIIDFGIGTNFNPAPYGMFYVIYSIGVFLPSLAVAVRRLHDTGKSGFMLLIALIPIIGCIWLLILLVTNGDHGDNQYGPDPKQEV